MPTAPAAVHTSLDYYRQSSPACPAKQSLRLLNTETGELAYLYCERLACAVCIRRQAWRYACAIRLARPETFVTFTRAGVSWSEIRNNINAMRRIVRNSVPGWQDAYQVERQRSGDPHVHLWGWGGQVPGPVAVQAAVKAGMGRGVDVQRCRGENLGYGLKTILGSPYEEGITPEIHDFLLLNGARLGHATRNFWRDHYGNPVGGVRKAMAVATSSTGHWVVTAAGHDGSALAGVACDLDVQRRAHAGVQAASDPSEVCL